MPSKAKSSRGGGGQAKLKSQKRDEGLDGKKKAMILGAILLMAAGLVIVIVMVVPGGTEDFCDTSKGKLKPERINFCLKKSCQFDVTQCMAPCPFGYDTGGTVCEQSCDCASEGIFQGDVHFREGEVEKMAKKYGYVEAESDFAVFSGSALVGIDLWNQHKENGRYKVYYTVDDGVDNNFHYDVQEYSKISCFDFLPRKNDEVPYLRVTSDKRGCWTQIGLVEEESQEMGMSRFCISRDVVEHEILHLLGFEHEHVRPDRDAFIEVHYNRIFMEDRPDFKKLEEAQDLGSEYDYNSIMHFSELAAAFASSLPTITPRKDVYIGRERLSRDDIYELHLLYGCTDGPAGIGGGATYDEDDKGPEYPSVVVTVKGEGSYHRYSEGITIGLGVGTVEFIGGGISVDDEEGEFGNVAEEINKELDKSHLPEKYWDNWKQWSNCGATCGRGHASRKRLCIDRKFKVWTPGCEGKSSEYRLCEEEPCPIPVGEWTEWETGRCSVTCGEGSSWQMRYCTVGDCEGTSFKFITCSKPPCKEGEAPSRWGDWGEWSACSTTCAAGVKSKTRQCFAEDGTLSLNCVGDYRLTGKQTRYDDCHKGSCYGRVVPQRVGQQSWNTWTEWSTCTRSCNTGTRSRSRKCVIGDKSALGCHGLDRKSEPCNTQYCGPESGENVASWGEWSSWSSCPVTCGGGTQTKEQKCIKDGQSPIRGCPEDSLGTGVRTERGNCNTHSCFTSAYKPGGPAQWEQWGQWNSCSKTCGYGSRKRGRQCSKDGKKPTKGCENDYMNNGEYEEWQVCNTHVCSDFGQPFSTEKPKETTTRTTSFWTQWGEWTRCTKTCESGRQTRERQCKSESSKLAHNCAGDYTGKGIQSETQTCNSESCSSFQQNNEKPAGVASWTPWTPWSKCSVTCGEGYWSRIRTCLAGEQITPSCTGANAFGQENVVEPCNLKPCASGRWRLARTSTRSRCFANCDGIHLRSKKCENGPCQQELDRCYMDCRVTRSTADQNPESLITYNSMLCDTKSTTVWYYGDFNGDKVTDVLCSNGSLSFELGHVDEFGSVAQPVWKGSIHGCTNNADIHVADINGDGKDDLLCQNVLERILVLKIANEAGVFSDSNLDMDFCIDLKDHLTVEDLDKDGNADMLCQHGDDPSSLSIMTGRELRPYL